MSSGSEKLLLHEVPANIGPEDAVVFEKLNKPAMEEDLSIEGSCRGLVLMRANNDRQAFFLYKPTTGELVQLPKPRPLPDHHVEIFCGIGYDAARDDYKLVVGTGDNKSVLRVDVFSLKSYSWRRVKKLDRDDLYLKHDGKYSNGFLHWLDREAGGDAIVSFNMATETFHEGILPSPSFTTGFGYTRLAVTGGGRLIAYKTLPARFEVSVLNGDGPDSAWTRLCHFSNELFRDDESLCITACLSPLMKDGKIVICVRWGLQCIGIYDPEDDSLKAFEIPVPRYCKWMTSYVE